MKRRRILFILLACVATVSLAFLFWPPDRESEPEYHGIRLSIWLARSRSSNPAEYATAADALHQMGTNILPILTRWIQYEPSGVRKQLWGLSSRLPAVVIGREPLRSWFVGKCANRAVLAEAGFAILGPAAREALPDLQRLAADSHAPETQIRAARCMTRVVRVFPSSADSQ